MGCHLWGRTESDRTKAMQQQEVKKTKYLFDLVLSCHIREGTFWAWRWSAEIDKALNTYITLK